MSDFFSREQDPPKARTIQESVITAEQDRKLVRTYQETGSVVEANFHNVTTQDSRLDLMKHLGEEISTKKMAKKFAELLDAKRTITDEEGNVITSVNLPSLQLKALKLLTEVRGDTAPIKIAKVSKDHKTISHEYVVKGGETVKVDDVDTTAFFAEEELNDG